MTEQQTNISFPYAFFAGVIAGIAEVSVNHPLWVIKTRMQSGYKPIFQMKGMYHGLFSNMVSMVPLIALRLSFASAINNGTSLSEQSSQNLMVASFIGGGIPSILSSPLEFVRTKQINNSLTFSATYKMLIKNNGYSVLSTGMMGTMGRDGLYTCGFFALAPIFKKKIHAYSDNERLATIISKPLAGTVSAFVSQPLDMIKTKQQLNETNKQSLINTTREIAKKEGIYGFFKGSTPRIARVISGVTIISTTYEAVTEVCRNHSQK